MSQQIADLTINLSADTAEFGQQMGRVERQLQETAEKAEASQRRMAQWVEQQAQSARSSAESTARSLQELNNQQEISQQQRADYYQRIAQEEARSAIESRKQADVFLEQAQSVGQTRDALEQLTEVLNKSTKAYDKLKITGEQLLADNKDNPQLSMMLAEQQKTFEAEENQRNNWLAGAKSAWADYRETALDVNTQVKNATSMALDGFSSQLTDVLVEREADFKAFTKSIFKMITNILVKMALIKGLEAFGFGGFSAPVANAKGGVYSSSSLSRYSGHIVNRPTLFAFAKGAGVMGEAGPEGIFPLRRGIDGKLGVVAKIPNQGAGFTQINNITIQNESSQGQISPYVLKKIYEISKRGAQDYILSQRRDGGGI